MYFLYTLGSIAYCIELTGGGGGVDASQANLFKKKGPESKCSTASSPDIIPALFSISCEDMLKQRLQNIPTQYS